MGYQVEEKNISDYRNYLVRKEREKGTIQKYMRDIQNIRAAVAEILMQIIIRQSCPNQNLQ